MFRPAAAALLALALLAPASALPQSASTPAVLNTPYRFQTVDGFDLQGPPVHNGTTYVAYATVTGVLQGESAPTTLRFGYVLSTPTTTAENARTFERCERFALLAMNKPGQFLLELRQEGLSYVPHLGCKLTRLPPPAP